MHVVVLKTNFLAFRSQNNSYIDKIYLKRINVIHVFAYTMHVNIMTWRNDKRALIVRFESLPTSEKSSLTSRKTSFVISDTCR